MCKTIEMLLRQDFDEYEVIVVDQTPSHLPEVQQRLDSLLGRIRYYKLDYPNIFAAFNLGIRVAQAEIINFLDDDVIIHKDYLMYYYRSFVNANDRIGGVMGLILDYEYSSEQDCLNMMKSRFGVLGEVKLGDVVAEE